MAYGKSKGSGVGSRNLKKKVDGTYMAGQMLKYNSTSFCLDKKKKGMKY